MDIDGPPFRVFVRPDGAEACTLRFACATGEGSLGVRLAGRRDVGVAEVREEGGIPLAQLREGRFVHVLPTGKRHTYALSRLPTALVGDDWVELDVSVEYGLRYLSAAAASAVAVPDRRADEAVAALERRVAELEAELVAARKREIELLELLQRRRHEGDA